ncbi:MAG: hypothetical protein K0U61_02595 [Alphaproteobacteria bacterium]|nr:hypothetical protein [Alphaproteobacteria bacterium]
MATQAGPVMKRHTFDGHSYLLPYDAVIDKGKGQTVGFVTVCSPDEK